MVHDFSHLVYILSRCISPLLQYLNSFHSNVYPLFQSFLYYCKILCLYQLTSFLSFVFIDPLGPDINCFTIMIGNFRKANMRLVNRKIIWSQHFFSTNCILFCITGEPKTFFVSLSNHLCTAEALDMNTSNSFEFYFCAVEY